MGRFSGISRLHREIPCLSQSNPVKLWLGIGRCAIQSSARGGDSSFPVPSVEEPREPCPAYSNVGRLEYGDLATPLILACFNREAGAVILNIAYGYRVEPFKRDPLVHCANVALDHFAKAARPGAWLVDVIPIRTYSYVSFPKQ